VAGIGIGPDSRYNFRPTKTTRNSRARASYLESLGKQTEALKSEGLFKQERLIAGPQQAAINVRSNGDTTEVLNLCANNYLGLANHPEVIAAAHKALDEYGYGMASVRFICGTQTVHKALEEGHQ
jgi:glycine C-acetyltransferase